MGWGVWAVQGIVPALSDTGRPRGRAPACKSESRWLSRPLSQPACIRPARCCRAVCKLAGLPVHATGARVSRIPGPVRSPSAGLPRSRARLARQVPRSRARNGRRGLGAGWGPAFMWQRGGREVRHKGGGGAAAREGRLHGGRTSSRAFLSDVSASTPRPLPLAPRALATEAAQRGAEQLRWPAECGSGPGRV